MRLIAGLAVAAMVSVGTGAWFAAFGPASPRTGAPVAVRAAAPAPLVVRGPETVAVWVGDSYLGGVGGRIQPQDAFPSLVSARLGWFRYLDAQGGSGYLNDGRVNSPDYRPYAGRLQAVAARIEPQVVIVSGGRNDLGRPGVGEAAAAYLRAVRAAWPQARLVVLEPFAVGAPGDDMAELQDDVRAAARSAGAAWIPTDGWITPKDVLDGVHPSPAGQARIAERLVPRLAALKVRPGPPVTFG